MSYCSKCGFKTKEDDLFCAQCGARIANAQTNQSYQSSRNNMGYTNSNPNDSYYDPSKMNNGPNRPVIESNGIFVWSLINTICCCLPLGIAGLVYVNKAKGAATLEEANGSLDTARTLSIIGTVVGVLIGFMYMISNF